MKRGAFTKPRFVLCEGNDDAALVRALIASAAGSIAEFDVSPVNDVTNVNGNSGFEESTIGASVLPGFEDVTRIVVVSDNDDNATSSFSKIRTQLLNAERDAASDRTWSIPTAPALQTVGDLGFSVWMWPEPGTRGCLETVLWGVVTQLYPVEAKCVENALQCSGADSWPVSKLDKARIRCFISLKNKKNPALPLSLVWRDAPSLFPLSNAAFAPFKQFLASV
jgi:hypothetical protein